MQSNTKKIVWEPFEDKVLVKLHNETNLSDEEIQEQFFPYRTVYAIKKRYANTLNLSRRKNRIPVDARNKLKDFLNNNVSEKYEPEKIDTMSNIEKIKNGEQNQNIPDRSELSIDDYTRAYIAEKPIKHCKEEKKEKNTWDNEEYEYEEGEEEMQDLH